MSRRSTKSTAARFIGWTSLSEKLSVLPDKALPLCRHVRFSENRRHRTSWDARVTVSAGRGVYVHLLVIGAALYAVNGADIDARQVFGADARLTYHVGQTSCSPRVIA
jgi:hypothetical protein